MSMLLAVDIGNTTVSFAVMSGSSIRKLYTVDSRLSLAKLNSRIRETLKSASRRYKLKGAIVCSVVPKITKSVEINVLKYIKSKPLVVGRNIAVPIKNLYRNPKQVGQDRLVCAFAAWKKYGKPVIVIDSGTAITFDVVSHKGEYLGGIIVPGIRLSAESLSKKTALLPMAKIEAPRQLIGRDTKGSILSGLFYGYGALSSGLIEQISKGISGKPKVVITGGYTALMKKFIGKKVNHIDQGLVFKGMQMLYAANHR